MAMRLKVLVASTFVCLSAEAFAQKVDCGAAETQLALNTCAAQDAAATDAQLSRTYEKLRETVSPAGRAKLAEARQAFDAYRTAQCAFDTAGTEGGSIHPMMLAQCVEALTAAQITILEAQLHCQEGDTSCGGQ